MLSLQTNSKASKLSFSNEPIKEDTGVKLVFMIFLRQLQQESFVGK